MSISRRLIQLERISKEPEHSNELVIPYSIEDAKLLHHLFHKSMDYEKKEFEAALNYLDEKYKSFSLVTLHEWEVRMSRKKYTTR